MDEQVRLAHQRRDAFFAENGRYVDRVPASAWPPGTRWCSGCQSFRLFDLPGKRMAVALKSSQCRPCLVSAKRVRQFGLTPELDAELGTSCNICGNAQRVRSLAPDHDHVTGLLRGKLCFRCNHLLLGGAKDSLPILKAAVRYLEDPPAQRILRELREKFVEEVRDSKRI